MLSGVLIISFVMIEGSWLYSTHGEVLEDYISGVESWSSTAISNLTSPSEEVETMPVSDEDVEEMLEELDEALEAEATDINANLEVDNSQEDNEALVFDVDRTVDEVLTYGSFLPVLKDTY